MSGYSLSFWKIPFFFFFFFLEFYLVLGLVRLFLGKDTQGYIGCDIGV